MPRRTLIAGNWKMNIIDKPETLKDSCFNKKVDVLVCPPFTHLERFAGIFGGTCIKVGAQNMYFEEKGAFTGEISPLFLKELGIEYVLAGHSERRHVFLESDEMIAKKVKKGVEGGFKTILCVGETLDERNRNKHKSIVENQLKIALAGIENNLKNIIIAYEPVWAIGTGISATPYDAQEMHQHVRQIISEIFGRNIAYEMLLLYGGSVNESNIVELLRQDDIDGALIGGASLKAETFMKIIESADKMII